MKENKIMRSVLLCIAWIVILAAGIVTYFCLQEHPLAYFENHPWNGTGINVALSIAVALFVAVIISLVLPNEPSETNEEEETDCFLPTIYIIAGIVTALCTTSIITGVAVFLFLLIITIALNAPKGPKGGLDP